MNINQIPLVKKLGHISNTSKMPCPSWSLSAFDCTSQDPICEKICYAKHARYHMKVVNEPRIKNGLMWLNRDWVSNFTKFIGFMDLNHFRWFDSGDIPNIMLLEKICKIADNCPTVKFWLPTRSREILIAYWEANGKKKLNNLHPNLIIRISAPDVNVNPDYELAEKLGVLVSSVKTENYTCNAKKFNNTCGSCRACWDQDVKEVSYYLH